MSLALCLAAPFAANAATGRVIKVLPQFLDLEGRNSLSPSLFERDAYQAYLRAHPKERSTVRFNVQWKTSGRSDAPLKLSIEARGSVEGELPKTLLLEQTIPGGGGWLGHWTTLTIQPKDYKSLGDVTAWRVTLWDGETLLGEQQSFLW